MLIVQYKNYKWASAQREFNNPRICFWAAKREKLITRKYQRLQYNIIRYILVIAIQLFNACSFQNLLWLRINKLTRIVNKQKSAHAEKATHIKQYWWKTLLSICFVVQTLTIAYKRRIAIYKEKGKKWQCWAGAPFWNHVAQNLAARLLLVLVTMRFERLFQIWNHWPIYTYVYIQWNLVIKRSDITKPSYNKVILLVPSLYISLFFYPDIMRNLI